MPIEGSLDPKEFKKKHLDKVSSSFCLAKWYEATMWLYMGETASCHHNPTHKIELDPNDLRSLHNTKEKIHERHSMLKGRQPAGCSYCWNAEKFNQASDRMYKSRSYDTELIATDIPDKVTPLRLEVAFSRTCNLGCAYCGPMFSSTWAKDIKNKGSYDLQSNDRFSKDLKDKLIDDEDNPYVDAFLEWWPELSKTLQIIRFTGGEPLLHLKFWDFLNLLEEEKTFRGSLFVNSNLIHHKGQVDRFIEQTEFLWKQHKVEIHTSCESNMAQAEFTRDGFKGDLWMENVHKVLGNSKIMLTITTAINNMSVWSYIDYLKMVNELREQYGKHRIRLNANRVLHPEIHQVQLIPKHYRKELAREVEKELPNLTNLDDANTLGQIDNFVKFMYESDWRKMHHEQDIIINDMLKFFDDFKRRRNKTEEGLDPRYLEWINGLR
jgi:organic radical activating enzyme|tara:strand:- start:7975 stop:9285 length:1311 start_codon:yes stop_codon:yes gene_type:complete